MQAEDRKLNDEEEVIDAADEQDEITAFRYSITAYGADYPVDALVKRMATKDIVVPTFDPDSPFDDIKPFQREFVWTKSQSDRFIESLLLGLPVPGIFLVAREDGRLLVLDGQQRLRTLHSFCESESKGRRHSLEKVQEAFNGKTYGSLDVEDRRRLDNSIIHATIVRQDEPSNDQSSVYMIFERLNTGGTSLQPQEIRVALYGGPFIDFLQKMNEFNAWRTIYGPKSKRLKDQELILRFFALLYRMKEYRRPMKDFLNTFVSDNRDFQLHDENSMKMIFEKTTTTVLASLGSRAFRLRRAINVAIMDSIMVNIADRIQFGQPIKDLVGLATTYEKLIKDREFLVAVESGTTSESSVRSRLRAARQAIQGLS